MWPRPSGAFHEGSLKNAGTECCRLDFRQPSNGWKEARPSIRSYGQSFQASFKFPPSNASPMAKSPPRNPQQVTEKSHVGDLVPVRGYAKEGDGANVAFVGIAA
jgi:hypothetical protein